MKRQVSLRAALVAVLFAIALGGVSVWIFERISKPSDDKTSDLTKTHPSAIAINTLAHTLMTRVSDQLVTVGDPERSMLGGVTLYDTPTLYGEFLCEVRAYRFPTSTVRGHVSDEDQAWERFEVERKYVPWKEPGTPSPPGVDNRASACAKLTDPRLYISGNGSDVIPAAEMLQQALLQARGGAVPFKVTCTDFRRRPDVTACDGMTLLRNANLRHVRQVVPDASRPDEPGGDWKYKLIMDTKSLGGGCGQSESLAFDLIYGPHSYSRNLRAIAISWDIIC